MPLDNLDLQPEQFASTRRYKALARYQAYLDGKQYEGRPDFWTGTGSNNRRVPLRERAPCIIYPLPRAAVNQCTRFTFGEGRFPEVKVEPIEPDDALSPGLTLTDDEAATLTQFCAGVIEQGNLKPRMRAILRRGLSVGTAVAIVAIREGRIALDLPHAQDCWPTFRTDCASAVTRLVWAYGFDKPVLDAAGNVTYKRHFFRRDIDEIGVTAYEDAPVEVGRRIEWTVDETQSYQHGLGFCPVLWMRNLADEYGGSIDGTSLYAELEDEFDALNFALSQRHRGLVYFGTPQPWETGVEDGDGPGTTGQTAAPRGGKPGYSPAQEGPFGVTPEAARKAAPDQVWSFSGKDVRIGLLETTGASFKVATDHVLDIRSRLLEAMDVILLDPQSVAGKGDMSAKALTLMYAPLLALVDELRQCWWTYGLGALITMVLRVVTQLDGRGIYLSGATRAASILKRFLFTTDTGLRVWMPPTLTPTWGDYFSPSNGEISEAVNTAAKAKREKLVQAETATRYVGPYFGVTDAVAELEAIEEDAPSQVPTVPTTPPETPTTPETP